jgi:predicted ATPase
MKIERLVIENFKSIERIELLQPNPFTVFVGPNGSGKSNIFEAIEFVNRCSIIPENEAVREFGGVAKLGRRASADIVRFYSKIEFDKEDKTLEIKFAYHNSFGAVRTRDTGRDMHLIRSSDNSAILNHKFSRIFVGNTKPTRTYFQDDTSLNFAATNLEPVLKRILKNETLKTEIFEWLELFVPGFKAVEVDDRNELHWFEEAHTEYFTRDLISDGTYNILALLAAVYQSDDEPQFLCIEEPENGLHPQVAGELVDFFRIMCEERGHHIWLNTHSKSMVERVQAEELVIVEKIAGATTIQQFEKSRFHGMRADEAWLSNVLNGGLAW